MQKPLTIHFTCKATISLYAVCVFLMQQFRWHFIKGRSLRQMPILVPLFFPKYSFCDFHYGLCETHHPSSTIASVKCTIPWILSPKCPVTATEVLTWIKN